MVLPDAEDASFLCVILPDARLRIIYLLKNRIVRFDNTYQPVLIFSNTIVAALTLFLAIERDDTRAKTQSNQLMSAANTQHRRGRLMNKVGKAAQNFRFVVIKVAQSATEDNRVGLELVKSFGEHRYVRDTRFGLLYQTLYIADYVL